MNVFDGVASRRFVVPLLPRRSVARQERTLLLRFAFPSNLKNRTLALIKTSLRFPVFFVLSKFPLIDVLMF